MFDTKTPTIHNDDPNNISSSSSSSSFPLLTFRAKNVGPKCPFDNDVIEFTIRPGGCISFQGNSGVGKTTLAMIITGVVSTGHNNNKYRNLRQRLDIEIETCTWHPTIPINERCGVLFQQTTLLDELTIAGNLQLALKQHYSQTRQKTNPTISSNQTSDDYLEKEIKQLLDRVGLDYSRDAHKRPTELSGGMGRRASLALQLAQHKRVIVLDEPFTGLDYDTAVSVAKELVRLRQGLNNNKTALLLISHEPHLAKIVLDEDSNTMDNTIVRFEEPVKVNTDDKGHVPKKPSVFGTKLSDRFYDRLLDYTLYSLPLIVMAFIACGIAIGMLTADLLARLDIADDILDLVDTQIRPLIKLLTGEEATSFQLLGIRFKVKSLLHQTVPPAKAQLFAIGMTKLMVLEIGPLLTALLLCGRIGGSYAGQVATLHATQQTKLLQTLGISPFYWTWVPSIGATLLACPCLTSLGTAIALGLAGYIGPVYYGIGTISQFQSDVRKTILPELRFELASLFSKLVLTEDENSERSGLTQNVLRLLPQLSSSESPLFQVTYPMRYPSWMETLIEILTYPPMYHLSKAVVYGWIILNVAQLVTYRRQGDLTPRGVPSVITMSVVVAGLLVIIADWGFSQLWLLRY